MAQKLENVQILDGPNALQILLALFDEPQGIQLTKEVQFTGTHERYHIGKFRAHIVGVKRKWFEDDWILYADLRDSQFIQGSLKIKYSPKNRKGVVLDGCFMS